MFVSPPRGVDSCIAEVFDRIGGRSCENRMRFGGGLYRRRILKMGCLLLTMPETHTNVVTKRRRKSHYETCIKIRLLCNSNILLLKVGRRASSAKHSITHFC